MSPRPWCFPLTTAWPDTWRTKTQHNRTFKSAVRTPWRLQINIQRRDWRCQIWYAISDIEVMYYLLYCITLGQHSHSWCSPLMIDDWIGRRRSEEAERVYRGLVPMTLWECLVQMSGCEDTERRESGLSYTTTSRPDRSGRYTTHTPNANWIPHIAGHFKGTAALKSVWITSSLQWI